MAEFLIGGALIFVGFALFAIADAVYDVAKAVRLISYKQNGRKAHEIRCKLNDGMTWEM